jgi:hypothetical protein
MSAKEKKIESKDMIYIAVGVVAVVGLTIFFSMKNSKLSERIEELVQRVEELEERNTKIETTLNQFNNVLGRVLQQNQEITTMVKNVDPADSIVPKKKKAKVGHGRPKVNSVKENAKIGIANVVFKEKERPKKVTFQDEINDSDLDEAIKEDLEELQ